MLRDPLTESSRMEIIRLCHSGLDSRTLRAELLQRLQSCIPFDYAYFSTTDPATQLGTGSVLVEDPPTWLMAQFLENEFLQADYCKFSDMLRDHQAVSVLSEATGNELNRSQRYREMLVPLKIEDELRAVFVADTSCWGTLCLHRGSRYRPVEAEYLAQLTPHIAEGLRKGLLLGNVPLARMPDGPGVLILAEDLSVAAMTAAAEHWLMELAQTERGGKSALPVAVRSVVAGLQAIEERGLVAADSTPKVRLRTTAGHWLVVYASWLRSTAGQAQIAVIFEMAQPAEITPLIMQAYQLTKREGEIVQCVLRGWSTTQIAARLHISPNTVQDHLKAIFAKADISSRRELAARIFSQQYLPQFLADAPLDSSGQFLPPE